MHIPEIIATAFHAKLTEFGYKPVHAADVVFYYRKGQPLDLKYDERRCIVELGPFTYDLAHPNGLDNLESDLEFVATHKLGVSGDPDDKAYKQALLEYCRQRKSHEELSSVG